MTVRYMIVTDERDGTTTHAVVATLPEVHALTARIVDDAHTATGQSYTRQWEGWAATDLYVDESGGTIGPLPDRTLITVTPVVWRGKGYVRADVSAIEQSDNLPLDNGMTTR